MYSTYICCAHVCMYLCAYYTLFKLVRIKALTLSGVGLYALEKKPAQNKARMDATMYFSAYHTNNVVLFFEIPLHLFFFYEVCNTLLSDTLAFTGCYANICKGGNPKCVLRALPNVLCQPQHCTISSSMLLMGKSISRSTVCKLRNS